MIIEATERFLFAQIDKAESEADFSVLREMVSGDEGAIAALLRANRTLELRKKNGPRLYDLRNRLEHALAAREDAVHRGVESQNQGTRKRPRSEQALGSVDAENGFPRGNRLEEIYQIADDSERIAALEALSDEIAATNQHLRQLIHSREQEILDERIGHGRPRRRPNPSGRQRRK